MAEIKVEDYIDQLGENYELVKRIWDHICEEEFSVKRGEPLSDNESPVDQCTDLEKLLLSCIAYLEDGEEKATLTKVLLSTIHEQHQISYSATIKIRSFFFIVVE